MAKTPRPCTGEFLTANAGLAEVVVAFFLLNEVMFNSVKNEGGEERFKFNSHLQEAFHLPSALLSIKPGARTIVAPILSLITAGARDVAITSSGSVSSMQSQMTANQADVYRCAT